MKGIIFILFLFLFSTVSFAQRTGEIALSGGVTNYVGDLANEKYFPMSSLNAGSSITLRNFLNNPKHSRTLLPTLDLQLRFSWHRLQYDETEPIGSTKGKDLRNYLRGIGFRNDLFGTEVDMTYNIYFNRYAPLSKPKLSLFFLAGVGYFYGRPKADLFNGSVAPENKYYYWNDGTIRDAAESVSKTANIIEKDGVYETDLRKWSTEGEGYSREVHSQKTYNQWNFGFPLGAGLRYKYNKLLAFAIEFNYYYFLTDYLDDVSERYVTYDELKSFFPDPVLFDLAKYISDPTGRGSNGVIGPGTSPRGNPDMKDSFTYLSFEVAYKFTWKKKGVYGQ